MGGAGPDESDTCRDFVVPAIQESGWADDAIKEQYPVQAEVRGRYLPGVQNRNQRRVGKLVSLLDTVDAIQAKRARLANALPKAVRNDFFAKLTQ